LFQLVVGLRRRGPSSNAWFTLLLRDQFKPGQMVALYGKVETGRDGEFQIIQPQFEI